MLTIIHALELVAIIILLLGGLEILKLSEKLRDYLLKERVLEVLEHNIPIGARVIYEEDTRKTCSSCKKATIKRRRRFLKVHHPRSGELTLKEITTIYFCSSCNNKSVSLRK